MNADVTARGEDPSNRARCIPRAIIRVYLRSSAIE
jgi:hypothetical protein